MPDVGKERAIFFVDCLPVVAMELWIIKILALNSPGLTKDIFPLGAWINLHFELSHVEGPVADSHWSRSIRWHYSPSRCARLIEKFFLVRGQRVRTNPLKERCCRALSELISMQAQRRRRGRGCHNRFGVIETSRGAGGEIAVIARRNVHGDYPLPDAIEVDANIHPARRGRRWLRRRGFRRCRPRWRLITSLRQQRRRLGCSQHGKINRPAHGTIDRAHL